MILCPGCTKPFESDKLFAHCFSEHPSMEVSALHELVADKSSRIADLEAHQKQLKEQAAQVAGEIAVLKKG